MRLLLDQGLPRSSIGYLQELGIQAEHVGQMGMAAASDAAILDAALERDAVVVSLDSDFHALLAMSGATSPSVVRIRVEGLLGAPLANLIQRVLSEVEGELEAGAVVSVNEHQIRVRSLPIGRKSR